MTPSVRHLKPEWIPEHPALQGFVQFIAAEQGSSPPAEEIQVKNGKLQDGYIDLQYVKNGHIFTGRLNAHGQVIQLNHGQFIKGKGAPDWGKGPRELRVPKACQTLHLLGGEGEAQVQCLDVLPPSQTTRRAIWWTGIGLGGWATAEAIFRLKTRQSFTMRVLGTLGEGMHLSPAKTPALRHLFREVPAAGMGLLAMHSSSHLSDAFGWHPRDQRHERWALSVGVGTLAHRATRGMLNRGKSKLTTDPVSFGTSLMSAALVDATVGRLWAEGSWERRMAHEVGFFIPAMLQGLQRDRELALFEKAGFGLQGKKWGGRLMVAGFLADVGYMGFNRLSNGPIESVRINRLYARAHELHDQAMHPVTALLKGAFSFLAPALTERLLTPGSYVAKAGEEMRNEDRRYITSVEGTLRHLALQKGLREGGDADTDSAWDWLREDNRLEDIRTADGRILPVAAVAEQLGDPKVGARLEGKNDEELIRYIQRQFRGYRLSESEAREVVDRIALYRVRSRIAELKSSYDPELRSLLQHFDTEGRLLPGHGKAFASKLLHG